MSPTSSETSQRAQNNPSSPTSPTPNRQQRRAALRSEKRAEGLTADLKPFFEVYSDQSKHCKYCL